MNGIDLLDCTLRDGAYIVDSQFGDTAIRGIINKLQEVGTEIIECGWLKDKPHESGSTYFNTPDDIKPYLQSKKDTITYTVMIDWDRYDVDSLKPYDGESIDAIRVVFPHGKYIEGMAVGEKIMSKGYKVLYQAANTLAYNDDELIALANEANRIKPSSLSVVDTFGAMYDDDLERIIAILDKHLDPEIGIGFHSHNNQQLAFSLTGYFVKWFKGKNRKIIVDSSLLGMGRGAGNATTELLTSYLNKKYDCHYNIDAVMDAIDIYMQYYTEKYNWGYSIQYCISGLYQCHVNNVAYLLSNHRTNAKDMRNIIQSLSDEDRRKYDYDLLEKKYVDIVNRKIDDSEGRQELLDTLKGRNIVLIAPGKSATAEQDRILDIIKERNAVVIGINALLPGYKYDYVFFVNSARYEYAREKNKNFDDIKKIVLSNINTHDDKNVIRIAYDHAIRQGWKYFDNASICALRMMDWLEIDKVAIVGFDGFKQVYNESYGDPWLPFVNPGANWKEVNEEINNMMADFRKNAGHCKNVEFLTASYFNK